MRLLFGLLGLVLAVATGAFLIYGRQNTWALLAPADLGPVEFDRLVRRSTPNDALAASPGLATNPDFELPTYEASAARVMDALDRHIAALGDEIELVAQSSTMRRFVTRSPTMRFPDTTVIEAVPLSEGRTGLRAYARASVGQADFGANEARLRRWLLNLEVKP